MRVSVCGSGRNCHRIDPNRARRVEAVGVNEANPSACIFSGKRSGTLRFGRILAANDKKVPDPVGSGVFVLQKLESDSRFRHAISENNCPFISANEMLHMRRVCPLRLGVARVPGVFFRLWGILSIY